MDTISTDADVKASVVHAASTQQALVVVDLMVVAVLVIVVDLVEDQAGLPLS